ncbi:HlyD family secretion protein [Aeromonas sp. MR19]|uniref:HlyD family secretion protein n=1 Tax=Aeromonas sp. MR19 TaxID=2923421 RepID=UPI001F4A4413|nr:HlyD family efflux transporter periplasmic adaptor subunit [Aeromonas sp. MR19]MCH7376109.1 HlyD family secretion protein [Aeromonas sp. MR19]
MFREEAVIAYKNKLEGRPIILMPLSIKVASYASLFIVLITLFLLICCDYTRRIQVNGIAIPKGDVIRIHSISDGTIDDIRVNEGQHVKKGDVILTLINEKKYGDINVRKEAIKLMESKYTYTQRQVMLHDKKYMENYSKLSKEVSYLRSEISITDEASRLYKLQFDIASENLKKHERLFKMKVISHNQYESLRSTWIDAQIKLNDIHLQKAKLLSALTEAEGDLSSFPIEMENERLSLEKDSAQLKMNIIDANSERSFQVLSPIDGILGSLNSFEGKNISRTQLLAVVIPDSSVMEGALYIPSKAIGFITKGNKVKVRMDAFPYQKFGHIDAVVNSVPTTALLPNEIPEAFNNKEMLYSVKIKFHNDYITAYGEKKPIRSSMTFTADVMLDKRKLFEWILEPLYTITGKL